MIFKKNFLFYVVLVSATLLATLSKADEAFNFAIGGDPQPWRTDCNVTGCPDPNQPPSSKVWLPLAQKAYKNMRKYNPQFVMINGDMTDFGWREQRTSISDLINGNGDLQTFYGLGNHDIENNVNDCSGSVGDYGYTTANACAFAMSDNLRTDIFKKFDMKPEGYFNHDAAGQSMPYGWGASNAYAFDWGKRLMFIQMNNFPTYEVMLQGGGIRGWLFGAYRVAWKSALPFLRTELQRARSSRHFVVLGWHQPDGSSGNNEFIELLKEYKDVIILLSAGHNHEFSYRDNYEKTGIPMIIVGPMFNSESVSVKYSESEDQNLQTATLEIRQVKSDGSLGQRKTVTKKM